MGVVQAQATREAQYLTWGGYPIRGGLVGGEIKESGGLT